MRTTIGYGQNHRQIAVDWVMELASSMIMVLTVIDRPTAIAKYVPRLQARIENGLVIQEPVTVVHHPPNGPSQFTTNSPYPVDPAPYWGQCP